MDSSLNALIHCETGETRRLGEYHFILLETLAKNADVVLSRSFLMTAVWKNRIVGGNSLPTAVHALRVAIDDDGKQQEIIKTIPKKGYLFNKNYLSEDIDHNINMVDGIASDETKESAVLSANISFPTGILRNVTFIRNEVRNTSIHYKNKLFVTNLDTNFWLILVIVKVTNGGIYHE